MEDSLFYIWLSSRMVFSDEDKIDCSETVRTIVRMAVDVRKSGLLSLENNMPEISDIFMKKALTLTLDLAEPGHIRKILHNYIIAGDYRGRELLRRILITEGMISIINGINPKMIEMELLSYFGEDFQPVHDDSKEVREIFESTIKRRQISEVTSPLNELLKKFDNPAIQRLLRDLDPKDIVKSIHGLSDYVIVQLLNNMSKRSAVFIMESCINIRAISAKDISEAQDRIMDKIDELKKNGDILETRTEK